MALLDERIKRASKTRKVANTHTSVPAPCDGAAPRAQVQEQEHFQAGGPEASQCFQCVGAARDNGTESEVGVGLVRDECHVIISYLQPGQDEIPDGTGSKVLVVGVLPFPG